MHLLHRFSVFAAQLKGITTSKTKFPVCLSCDTRVQGLFQFDLYIVVAKQGNPSRFLGTLSFFFTYFVSAQFGPCVIYRQDCANS